MAHDDQHYLVDHLAQAAFFKVSRETAKLLTMGLLEGIDLVNTAVNSVAASVCGQAGAIP